MGMLRHNDDSVMAMLEAFVHDPLINWRLLVKPPADESARARSDGSVSLLGEGHNQDPRISVERGTHAPIDDEQHDPVASHPASFIGTPLDAASFPLSSSLVSASRRSRVEPVHDLRTEGKLNERALSVLQRVNSKLVGSDFEEQNVSVATQVNLLIEEARADINLCQLYVGWCAFW